MVVLNIATADTIIRTFFIMFPGDLYPPKQRICETKIQKLQNAEMKNEITETLIIIWLLERKVLAWDYLHYWNSESERGEVMSDVTARKKKMMSQIKISRLRVVMATFIAVGILILSISKFINDDLYNFQKSVKLGYPL